MPARKKPTFLKRQKELQRVARANEKRDQRRARKHAKSLGIVEDGENNDFELQGDEMLDAPLDGPPHPPLEEKSDTQA